MIQVIDQKNVFIYFPLEFLLFEKKFKKCYVRHLWFKKVVYVHNLDINYL